MPASDAGTVAFGDVTSAAYGGDVIGRDQYAGDRVAGDKIAVYGGNAPVVRRRPPSTVPELPPHFVPRVDLTDAVIHALTDQGGSTGRMVGLAGMGGSGKSVLARAIAQDVQAHGVFSDGVVWLDVGPNPDLVMLQTRLLDLFGDARPVLSIEQGVDRLNALFDGASCLVVLDNVWDANHLKAFEILEAGCRLLVTTRDRSVLNLRSASIDVDPLATRQARELLAAWAGQCADDLPSDANDVAARCGGLPLAIAIAGGMVADGRSWRNVLTRLRRADFDKLNNRFSDYPHPTLLAALDASVATLPNEQRQRYLDLAVFEGFGGVPLAAAYRLWQSDDFDDLDGEDLVILLRDRSLVRVDSDASELDEGDLLDLHDLQFDYAHRELGDDRLRDLHWQIASGYLEDWGGIDTAVIHLHARLQALDDNPGERYGVQHAVAHLQAARGADTIHKLLALEWPATATHAGTDGKANAWYAARDHIGDTAGYLRDIRAAWRLAEDATNRAPGRQAASIGLELRYGLIASSITSIAANLPPALLGALVDEHVWTSARALAYGRAIPSPDGQAAALGAIAARLPDDQRATVIQDALTAASSINHPYRRAQTLTQLLPHVPDAQRATVVGDTLTATRSIDHADWQAQTLADLAPHIPDHQWSTALAVVNDIDDPDWQAQTLADLAPHIPDHQWSTALATVSEIDDARRRAHVLGAFAPHVSHDRLPDAVAVSVSIDRSYWRAQTLAQLVAHFPDNQRATVIDDALTATRSINHAYWRARTLAQLLPHVSDDQRTTLVHDALAIAGSIDDAHGRVRALTALAPHLPGDRRATVIDDALTATRSINHPYRLAQTLTALAPYVPDDQRATVINDALTATRSIDHPHGRAQTVADLAPHLPDDQRATLIHDALTATRSIDHPDRRAQTLANLAPHIPDDQWATALATAKDIDHSDWQAQALAALAPHVPTDQRRTVVGDALVGAGTIDHPDRRAQTLANLAPHIPDDQWATALATAKDIDHPDWQAQALAALAPHVPTDQRRTVVGDALAAIAYIDRSDWQAQALARLAPHVHYDQWLAVLGSPSFSTNPDTIMMIGSTVAGLQSSLPTTSWAQFWRAWFRTLSAHQRPQMVRGLAIAHAVVADLGGTRALLECCQALSALGRWWQ